MISARNKFKGKVTDVAVDDLIGEVKVRVAHPLKVSCIVTREAIEELKIKEGDKVIVFIKATEVMIEK